MPVARCVGTVNITGYTCCMNNETIRDPSGKRNGYHRENLRQELLDRGLALLARDGLAGFSLRALAKELGVTHTAPYRHFSTREQLLSEIVRESMNRFEQALMASIMVEGDDKENLYRLGEAYVRFYLENPEILSLFNILPGALAGTSDALVGILRVSNPRDHEPCQFDPDSDRGFRALRQAASAFFSQYPDLSERDVLLGFWAKAHGLACLLVANPDWFAPESLESGLARVMRNAF